MWSECKNSGGVRTGRPKSTCGSSFMTFGQELWAGELKKCENMVRWGGDFKVSAPSGYHNSSKCGPNVKILVRFEPRDQNILVVQVSWRLDKNCGRET